MLRSSDREKVSECKDRWKLIFMHENMPIALNYMVLHNRMLSPKNGIKVGRR